MLKFWKNTGRGKSKFSTRPPESTDECASPSSVQDFDVLPSNIFNFENLSDSDLYEITSYTSRLSKSLDDMLMDKHPLGYLAQYLESVSASSLIEFWIEAKNFKCAAESFSKEQVNKKVLQHSSINRTVSFDSSITKQDKSPTKSQINGFYEFTKNNVNSEYFCDRNNALYMRASCSNIVSKDMTRKITQINSKQDLLHESVMIFKKYIALESPNRLDIPEDIRNTIVSSICHPEGVIDPNIFKVVQDIVYKEIQIQHFHNFLQTAYHCKYQIDILTSGTLTIEDILFNQMALFYFTEYLEQERCTLILEFVLAVINFRDLLSSNQNYDPEQAQNDAIILYDKYFSLQATSPLGFPSEVRFEMEENICREGGPLPDCFHKPFRLALQVLQQYIGTFLTSQLYYKYLSEMISSVEDAWQSKHKKSSSDCSSEISINARNTLLAMEDFPSSSKNKRQGSHTSNMRIDSKQLYNGDLLWRRKTDKGLCLGRVNSLGRFESCMEPDPEKKDSSVIRRVVSKLVHGEKEKAKEELAWQVAHMIVKGITDVTMGIPENQL